MAKTKQLKPNYRLMLASSITSMKMVINEWRKAVDKDNNLWGITDNGDFWVYTGVAERRERIKSLENEMARLYKEIANLKQLVEKEEVAAK